MYLLTNIIFFSAENKQKIRTTEERIEALEGNLSVG